MSRSNYPIMNQNMSSFPMQTQMPQPLNQMNNVLQVMGPESAQAFQIGPDSQVILMDSNKPIFYMKKSDSSGYSETKAFKFEEIPLNQETIASPNNHQQIFNKEDYVTRQDFEEYKKMIEDLVMKDE